MYCHIATEITRIIIDLQELINILEEKPKQRVIFNTVVIFTRCFPDLSVTSTCFPQGNAIPRGRKLDTARKNSVEQITIMLALTEICCMFVWFIHCKVINTG